MNLIPLDVPTYTAADFTQETWVVGNGESRETGTRDFLLNVLGSALSTQNHQFAQWNHDIGGVLSRKL